MITKPEIPLRTDGVLTMTEVQCHLLGKKTPASSRTITMESTAIPKIPPPDEEEGDTDREPTS